MRLYEHLPRQGYRGGRSTVLGSLTPLRKAQGLAPRTRTMPPAPPVTDPTVQRVTPRQATWWTLRQPTEMTESEQHLLTRLHHAHAAFAQAIVLAQGFAPLRRARQPERLDAWVQEAATSSLAALQR
jgi:transposase